MVRQIFYQMVEDERIWLGSVGGMRDAPHKGQVEEVMNTKPVYRVDPLPLRQEGAHQNYQMNHYP